MALRTIHPIGDHIVVRFHTDRETSEAGIVIPLVALKRPQEATVVAVGPGSRDKTGQTVPLEVLVGDVVFVARHAGTRVIVDEYPYTIVQSVDILAVRT